MIPLSEMTEEWKTFLTFSTLIFTIADIVFLAISIAYRASKLFYFIFSIIFLVDMSILILFAIFKNKDIDYIHSDFLYNISAVSVTILIFSLILTAAILFITNMNSWDNNVSYMSIKETYDLLPDGVCIYDESGTPLLINTYMDYLSMVLTGELLLNAAEFYEQLREGRIREQNILLDIGLESDIVIRIPNDKTYRFSRNIMNIDKKRVNELVAVEITNEIFLNEELISQKANLTKMNRHLQEYSDSVMDYTREQERLTAKGLWGDNVRQVIRDTGALITAGDLHEDSDIYMRWQKVFELIQAEFDFKKKDEPLADLMEAAKIADLKIIIDGNIPVNNRNAMRLLISGTRECLMDAIGSKSATTVFLRIDDTDFNVKINISNDKVQSTESDDKFGELARIASIAKQAGGDAKIVINPMFKLEISVPRLGGDFYDAGSYS